jgi:Alpha/beta-hydrolase family
MEPIRVYVGLRSAETPAQRAKLALEELKRAGAFERSWLIVTTPTGTGWVDPGAMDSVEYLHDGDVIGRQEYQAWDVLLPCQGQLRLAPTGHVIGIDMSATLRGAPP